MKPNSNQHFYSTRRITQKCVYRWRSHFHNQPTVY